MTGGPPAKSGDVSQAYANGYMDGYGNRAQFDPDYGPQDPDYRAGKAKGRKDAQRTDRNLRKAGLR